MLQWVDRNFRNSPNVQATLHNFIARNLISFPDVVDDSYKVFANVRDVRFNEMEYSVPADAGVACLREVAQHLNKPCFGWVVEAAGWLVEQQQRRASSEDDR